MSRIAIGGLLRAMVLAAAIAPSAAMADEAIGQIKTEAGAVFIQRQGVKQPARIGERLFRADTITTGANSTVGITFADNTLMSLGPRSALSLDRFQFNTTTHVGQFEAALNKGTLAVKSGQIVRQTPGALRVRTPAAILGVRGTEFAVRVGDRA